MEALDRLSVAERTSRAAIIRSAITDYLKEKDRQQRRKTLEAGFGIWKDRGIDGLDYQERIRSEWDRDSSA